jgi:N-methylhydantoinase B/oxoprolinase/acetone carboxylase alpha subunit
LVQKSAAGALFSQAGTKTTSQFSNLLTNVFGKPQRGLWRSRKFIAEQGSADIMRAVDEVIADANRALQARLSDLTVQKRAA